MGSGMLMMVLVPAFLMLVMVVLGIVGLREMRRGAQLEARGRRTEGRVISSIPTSRRCSSPPERRRARRLRVRAGSRWSSRWWACWSGGFILGPALFLAVLV